MSNLVRYMIQLKGQHLFLHKTSNMFTTDKAQARVYRNRKSAEDWIERRKELTPYNVRFTGLDFTIREVLLNKE